MSESSQVMMVAASSAFSFLPVWYSPIFITTVMRSVNFAVVEVRPGLRYIAQGWHLEHHFIGGVSCHFGASEILAIGPRFHGSELAELMSAQQRAGVAGVATLLDKLQEAGLFRIGERGFVAGEKFVPASGGEEGALKGGDGHRSVVQVHRIRLAGKRFVERRYVLRHRLQNFRNINRRGCRHFDGVHDGAAGLCFNIGRAAIPELDEMGGGVEDSRRVAISALAFEAERRSVVVDTKRARS